MTLPFNPRTDEVLRVMKDLGDISFLSLDILFSEANLIDRAHQSP